MNLLRRRLLLAAAAAPFARAAAVEYAAVVARPLVFPRDHGAHPAYRLEWWYLTGWLDDATTGASLGFQITFFRTRTSIAPDNPSRFAAHQLLFAHAALADVARGSLVVDERIARAGFGFAHAAEHDTDVVLDRWRLKRRTDGAYEADIAARGFRLRFKATPTQPLLLQGEAGFSRKGPRPEQASHYYSQPQLAVSALLSRDGGERALRGTAWLDHEWSSTLLDPAASGWDWIGMNLDDGAALTAFQIRRRGDGAALYAYASLRAAGETRARTFAPHDVRFAPMAHWRSPRTRAQYPIAQRITVGTRVFETQPLMPDQELDTRLAGSTVYWEGASTLFEAGRRVGRGYLELTGYAAPLAL